MSEELFSGRFPVKPPISAINRMTLLLWGAAGAGKTTFAATAPGTKLWVNFDPEGYASVAGRNDVLVLDASAEPSRIVEEAKSSDPFGLGKFLKDRAAVETVVVDSVTAFAQQAVRHSYEQGKSFAPGAVMENPGPAGYGMRNRFTLLIVTAMLRLTRDLGKHLVLICHEDVPSKDKEGNITGQTLLLGGSLPTEVPLQMSEVWHLGERVGGTQKITVRSTALLKPMKTRMFVNTGEPSFKCAYNADTGKGEGIKDWYEKWKGGGFRKLPLPV